MSDELALFVRPKKGFAVPRYGTAELIGARRSTSEEIAKGAESIVWDEERIVPLPTSYVNQYRREIKLHLRNKELVEATREEWTAQCARRAASANAPTEGNK